VPGLAKFVADRNADLTTDVVMKGGMGCLDGQLP
jgi:hypothetical protein